MVLLKSITSRIIFLHVLAIAVTSAFMPIALYVLLRSAAEDLQHRSLQDNASLIAQHLSRGADGTFALHLPPDLSALFSETYGRYAYAIIDEHGTALFSSLRNHSAIFNRDSHTREPVYLARTREKAALSGAIIPIQVGNETLWVQVAQDLQHRDVLIDDIVHEFFIRAGWITIPILLFLLVVDVSIFRRALSPLLKASELAEKIGPKRTDVRLPAQSMPTEIRPLVQTVNQALDRLEQGFRAQREFTADAAHELRTPLSILKARVDTLPDKAMGSALSKDISLMTRVIAQLLDIAELETFALGQDDTADLKAVCIEVVEFMAPLALADGKEMALDAPDHAVLIRGNHEVLFRAIRNVVENAIKHTPKSTTVSLLVKDDGSVSICDQGPGIPQDERSHMFRRFWRGDRAPMGGKGVGLSIVQKIVDAHDGEIIVNNLAPAGLEFIMAFQPSAQETIREN